MACSTAQALADADNELNALTERLEARARWAEDGEAADSPYLALAAHLCELAAQLIATDAEHTDMP